MSTNPSLAIRLFGTDEPVTPPRLLRAGPLTAELDGGNLRYVRFNGTEIIRAISFIVRDKDWGTYGPTVSDLHIDEGEGRFRVRYSALASDGAQAFRYAATIEGSADGRLVFSGTGAGETDFLTNRTGFVILHPIADVAGKPVEIVHVDGSVEQTHFPELINPLQPMLALRSLRHWTPDGLAVTCLMEGDTFEMEDQRNWTDASYKTYVRPLALPWPYSLKQGEPITQKITLTVDGNNGAAAGDGPVTIALGKPIGTVPAVGQGIDAADANQVLAQQSLVARLGIQHLICHHDPRRGDDGDSLARQLAVAQAMGAQPWLEAVVVSVDNFVEEIQSLGALVANLGAPFETILLSPAADLKGTLPGSVWPPTPPAAALYDTARTAFPGKRIGGGMFSYFTELNRKRPPIDHLDLVSFTTSPMVHAGDDRSVMETIQAVPAVVKSVAAIAGGKPYAVGPSAIGVRDNPYGAEAKQNFANIRQAMNWNDPRQRGLLGAAWNLAYFAGFASGGASAIALGAPIGAFGVVSSPTAFPQPWYDENQGAYPVYHVIKGLAALHGKALLALQVSRPDLVQGIAVRTDAGTEVWLANLGGQVMEIALDFAVTSMARLDAETFLDAAQNPDHMTEANALLGGLITLNPYAVVRLCAAHTY